MEYIDHGILLPIYEYSTQRGFATEMRWVCPFLICSPRTRQRVDEAVKGNVVGRKQLTNCYQPPPLEIPPNWSAVEDPFKVPGPICGKIASPDAQVMPLPLPKEDVHADKTSTSEYVKPVCSPEPTFSKCPRFTGQLSLPACMPLGSNTPDIHSYQVPYSNHQDLANRGATPSKTKPSQRLGSVEVSLNAQHESFVMQALRQTYANSTGRLDEGDHAEFSTVPSWPQLPDLHKIGKRNSTFLGRASSASVHSQYQFNAERPRTADALTGRADLSKHSPVQEDRPVQRPSVAISTSKVQFKKVIEDKAPSFSASEEVESVAIDQMTSLLNEAPSANIFLNKPTSAKQAPASVPISTLAPALPVDGPSHISEFSDFGNELYTNLKKASKDVAFSKDSIPGNGKIDTEPWVDVIDFSKTESEFSDFYHFLEKEMRNLPTPSLKTSPQDSYTSVESMPIYALPQNNQQIIEPTLAVTTVPNPDNENISVRSLTASLSKSDHKLKTPEIAPQNTLQKNDNKSFGSKPATPEQSDSISVDITESLLIKGDISLDASKDADVAAVLKEEQKQTAEPSTGEAEYGQDSFVSTQSEHLAVSVHADSEHGKSLDLDMANSLLVSVNLDTKPGENEPVVKEEAKVEAKEASEKEASIEHVEDKKDKKAPTEDSNEYIIIENEEKDDFGSLAFGDEDDELKKLLMELDGSNSISFEM